MDVQEISQAIKEMVSQSGQIPGSRLSADLKERFPGWKPAEFGARNLREFVDRYVEGVKVVGRSGMDVIYGLTDGLQYDPQPDFWRIWVSPRSPFALIVDGANLKAVKRGTKAENGQVQLEPPSVEQHKKIAQDFLGQVSEDERVRLQAALERSSEAWWREIQDPRQLTSWYAFRQAAFERLLREQLHIHGVVETEKVVRLLRPRPSSSSLLQSPEHVPTEDLRRVVIEAARRMSVAELRNLRLPVGIVLDILLPSKR